MVCRVRLFEACLLTVFSFRLHRWEVATAGLRRGIVIAPATTLLTAADIEYRCQKSNAKAFVGDATGVAKVLQIRHRCPSLQVVIQVDGNTDPGKGVTGLGEALQAIKPGAVYTTSRLRWNSPAILYFTSGTSGLPKMVRHNQVSYPLGAYCPLLATASPS